MNSFHFTWCNLPPANQACCGKSSVFSTPVFRKLLLDSTNVSSDKYIHIFLHGGCIRGTCLTYRDVATVTRVSSVKEKRGIWRRPRQSLLWFAGRRRSGRARKTGGISPLEPTKLNACHEPTFSFFFFRKELCHPPRASRAWVTGSACVFSLAPASAEPALEVEN